MTQGLRLVMAVSADGYVARGAQDDMSWTGRDDKQVFRLLTHVGGLMGAGSTTFDQMPDLHGRRLVRLSRHRGDSQMTLGEFAHRHPGAWLIGGQEVAELALRCGLLDEVHLCRSPVVLGDGIKDSITPFLEGSLLWTRPSASQIRSVRVEHWRHGVGP